MGVWYNLTVVELATNYNISLESRRNTENEGLCMSCKTRQERIDYRFMRPICAILAVFFLCESFSAVFDKEMILFSSAATQKCKFYVDFGTYPQDEVKDVGLITELNDIADGKNTWKSYDCDSDATISGNMKYIDIELNGEKYRGVTFSLYRSMFSFFGDGSAEMSYQDENGYFPGTVYWFKFAPLKWRILSEYEGSTKVILLCENIVDARQFYRDEENREIDGETVCANNYNYSDIRSWLNDTFFDSAFSKTEAKIIENVVDSDVGSENENAAAEGNNDAVRLPNLNEACNENYGFDSQRETSSAARIGTGTDYALCRGLYSETEQHCGFWRLSDAGECESYAVYVDANGCILEDTVTNTSFGVRPVISLDLTQINAVYTDHEYSENVVPPTCTEQGYTEKVCAKCGDIDVCDYVAPDGHKAGTPTKEGQTSATCTADGSFDEVTRCSKCGTIMAIEHKTVDALGHDPDAVVTENMQSAACTTYGGYDNVIRCKRCHEVISSVHHKIEAKGHSWSDWTEAVAATAENNGKRVRTCSVCGREEAESIPKLPSITISDNSGIAKIRNNFVITVTDVSCGDIFTVADNCNIIIGKGKTLSDEDTLSTGDLLALVKDGKILSQLTVVALGDLDCDGTVSVQDARLALRASVGLESLEDVVFAAACVTHATDRKVDVSDARTILRAAVKLENPTDWLAGIA